MEDKTFEMLTQMYSDIKQQFEIVNRKLDEKADKTDIVRLENDHGTKLAALLDGYKQLSEGQEEIKTCLDNLASNIEKQDIEITVLQGRKQVAR